VLHTLSITDNCLTCTLCYDFIVKQIMHFNFIVVRILYDIKGEKSAEPQYPLPNAMHDHLKTRVRQYT